MESFTVPIDPSHFAHYPPRIRWAGEPLDKKEEFHVTALDGELRLAAAERIPRPMLDTLLESFDRRVRGVLPHRLTNRVVSLADRGRRTLIQLVDLPELDRFHDTLRAEGLELPEPFPHVTLYMRNTVTGIGAPNVAVYEARRDGEPVDLDAVWRVAEPPDQG